jgi:Ca-activated chloride channel family protein
MKTLKLLVTGLTLLCLIAPSLQAQQRPGSLRGIITDIKTGEGIPFANIAVKDSMGLLIAGGTTDIDGKYNINPILPSIYTVEITVVGYSKQQLTGFYIGPNVPTIRDFQLSEAESELNAVEVVYSKPLIDRWKSSKVFSPNEGYSGGNISIKDKKTVQARAAGVTADAANGSINVRGSRASGTVYYINGVKVRSDVAIPQAAIQSTEVITGGLPAQYGDSDSHLIGPPQHQTAHFQYGYTSPPVTTRSTINESYAPIQELPFKAVTSAPLSTFASDVDAASYANVRKFITEGQLPPADAVRIEEMVNYFNYNYPNPDEGEVFSMNTELAACPWKEGHQLLRIGIKTKEVPKADLPDNNLVFLIDVSGSMGSNDKLPLLKKSLRLLVDNLNESDRVAIVVYASATGLVLESTKGTNKSKIIRAINQLHSGGSTAGGAGIQLAYKVAEQNFKKGENNRVILATDGDFNVGLSSDDEMIQLIEKKRESGIFLTVLGFGTENLKDAKMEKIADHGNGNYAYIDNLMEAHKVLVNEMGATLNTVAKDTKFQIEFNPMQVKAYRLIGYENRMLEAEDFNDDTKDAGDVGSGHSVTAIYEIIPAYSNEEVNTPPVDALKYQQKTGLVNDAVASEFATLKIRYKAPNEDVSILKTKTISTLGADPQMSEDFKFICGVIEAGMLLRSSTYAGASSFEEAKALAKAGKGEDENGYRGEFIRLISLAERLHKNTAVGMR